MTTLTDEQVLAGKHDVEMLKRPHLWPGSGRTINVEGRGKHADRFGICVRDGSGFRVVRYKGVSYDLEPVQDGIYYSSAEALVEDGWRVD